ncbi:hypothetical protein RQP46_001686 [Phenoliferia psychrophenolica]
MPHLHSGASECALETDVGSWSGGHGSAKNTYHYRPNLEFHHRKLANMSPKVAERYTQQRLDLKGKIWADADKLRKWETGETTRRATEHEAAWKRRVDSIEAKLTALGWNPDIYGPAWKHMGEASQPTPLSDRIWNKIRPAILAACEAYTSTRRESSIMSRLRARQERLRPTHEALGRTSVHPPATYLTFGEFLNLPSVSPYWTEEWDGGDDLFDGAGPLGPEWDADRDQVSQEAESLVASQKSAVVSAIRQVHVKAGVLDVLDSEDPFGRATARFGHLGVVGSHEELRNHISPAWRSLYTHSDVGFHVGHDDFVDVATRAITVADVSATLYVLKAMGLDSRATPDQYQHLALTCTLGCQTYVSHKLRGSDHTMALFEEVAVAAAAGVTA